jgi:hypothetical protein
MAVVMVLSIGIMGVGRAFLTVTRVTLVSRDLWQGVLILSNGLQVLELEESRNSAGKTGMVFPEEKTDGGIKYENRSYLTQLPDSANLYLDAELIWVRSNRARSLFLDTYIRDYGNIPENKKIPAGNKDE